MKDKLDRLIELLKDHRPSPAAMKRLEKKRKELMKKSTAIPYIMGEK